MRDPLFELVEDGPDGKIVLEFLERLLDFGELHVVAPQLGGIFTGHVGAQQVAALAAKHLSQFLATQAVGEPVGGQLFVGVRDIDLNEEPSSASVFLRRAELEHELVATVRLSSKSPRRFHSFFSRRRRMPGASTSSRPEFQ